MFSSERLKGIDLFVCVADLGSFTAAAERLNLTGSAISKGIARLESRLQVRLFNRTTRRLSLTDAGETFYRTCTSVLGELEEAELAMQAENAEPRGRVRIDLPAAYGRLHALPVILKLIEHHPLLMPHISFSDRFVDPVIEGIDIIVRIGGADIWPNTLGHCYLGAQRHIFCASPAYVKKRGVPNNEQDLDNHSCVVYGEGNGMLTPWHFAGVQANNSEKRVLPARVAIGDAEGQLTAVLAGHGIAQLPTWLVKRQLAEGSLVEVLPHLATDGLPINLAWLKSRQALPKVRALLKILTDNLGPDGSMTELA
ncbi:TPA: LysR substrate-binding domain-containing protein [Serratia liquefaciens]|uniref:LysR family transcriptional regulator n=1 Tax=Serratia liquefaciens TaxID=614 RepID=UPI00102075B7|nr:LysR family transcriptional regulator [Serratia liquefaciens]MDU4176211.1 LysR family transcriptional regulator [Serratia liquefaciens]RYM74312.1 LysR family transcriptional regulator [Serratia liquefaciens]HCT7984969.1 LysR family transcriptional regulator [Serratia liquefaciens]